MICYIKLKHTSLHCSGWFLFNTHLSVMATCSSIAEPVLVFQLPDIDVLLRCVKHKNENKFRFVSLSLLKLRNNSATIHTCRLCSQCQSSGFWCRTWSRWEALWWCMSGWEPRHWLCPGTCCDCPPSPVHRNRQMRQMWAKYCSLKRCWHRLL